MSKHRPCPICGAEYTRLNPRAFIHGSIMDTPVTVVGHRACIIQKLPKNWEWDTPLERLKRAQEARKPT